MLKQLVLIVPLLVQAAFAAPGVEPRNLEARHQHLHGHIEHTHGEKQEKKLTTSVRRQTEQTAAPQGFINPKMPYALKPQTKARKTTTSADSDGPKETVVPEFIPPKMPFVAKASRSKTTNEDSSVQVESVKKKTVAKVQDDDDDELPTFIPPRAPFRGPRKPQQTQATGDVPRDTLPAFIPPKNPWGTSKHNTRPTDTDEQDAAQETAIPDPQQRAYNDQDDDDDAPAFSSSPELVKRDETDGDNEFFEEEDSEYDPSDFPNLDHDESDNGSDEESQDNPTNETDQSHDNEQPANDQDDGPYQNHFGGDFDEEDDANDTPTRLEARGAGKRNILYFTNWGIYGADFQPQDIPAKEITHVLYSFALVNPTDGTVSGSDANADTNHLYPSDAGGGGNNVYGCVKQLYLLKKKNRNLKVLLSIGGWDGSPNLASGVSTQARRQRFISTAVKLITDWGFDGIDVDWEYPKNSQEARNYILILAGLRKALDQYSKTHKLNYHFLLTVATSAGASNYNIMDMRGMDPWLDGWHLMAYDYAGPWVTTTGHQSNVYLSTSNPVSTKLSTHQAINDYIAAGVPASKILMGMALYGRSFLNTDGLGKSYSGTGTYLLKALPQPGATQYFDSNIMATYTYDSKKRELVTYDNIASGKAKAGYINQRGLGGAFYWEASGDKSGSSSVVAGVRRTMGTVEKVNNLLNYPTSKYNNLRAGMP